MTFGKEAVVTARLLTSIMALAVVVPAAMSIVAVAPADAALVHLDSSYGMPPADDDAATIPLAMIAGAADFRTLSRPIPITFEYGVSAGTATDAFAINGSGTTWPPNSFQRVEDPLILPDLPPSAGWVPLVGGLALVAYRMRRTDKRFRFRSAV